ncbi:hypothetical protein, partial [Bacteroides gallinarum]|uniref:hypothetical protein n=1 Tax=Bacteroides gallinarum TaxID=376806 RepID=UPI0019D16E26
LTTHIITTPHAPPYHHITPQHVPPPTSLTATSHASPTHHTLPATRSNIRIQIPIIPTPPILCY